MSSVTSDKERAELELIIGQCYLDQNKQDSGIYYLEKARIKAYEIFDDKMLGDILFALGKAYFGIDNGLEAIDCLNEGLKLRPGFSADKRLESYNIMGVIYSIFDEPEKSIEYFDKALALRADANEITGKRYEYLYNNKGINFAKMNLFDSSMYNHSLCLAIRLLNQDDIGIGQSYNNMGTVYFETEKYDSALYYFELGLDYRQRNENATESSIQESTINISRALIKLGRLSEARTKLGKVEQELIGKANATLELRLYESLMNLYGQTRDYKNAYTYSTKYYELKDSVFGIKQREELIRFNLNSKYTERKLQDSLVNAQRIRTEQIHNETERAIQKEKNRTTGIALTALLIALVLASGIALLIYRNYRSKKRTSEEILKQKQEVEHQRDLADQQREIAQNQKAELELVHQEITDSITYAKRIQNAILPADGAVQRALQNQFVLYLPKAIVAGDFYWVRELDDKVYFAAADCTGHGVPGALVSIVCSNALNRSVEEFSLRQPGEILDKTTDLIMEAFLQTTDEVKDGMDISLCCLNKATGQISFSGANNPIYIIKEKEKLAENQPLAIQNEKYGLIEIKGNRQSVGWLQNRQKFQTHILPVEKGDMLYSFTDGFPDQFGGGQGKKYKYLRFKQFLLEIVMLEPQLQKQKLESEFNRWKGALEQVDDVCILGYKA